MALNPFATRAADAADGRHPLLIIPRDYFTGYTAGGAMECATVANCVTLAAQAVACLRFETPDARLRRLLAKPNDWQTRMDFMSGLAHSVLFYGNGYILQRELAAELVDPGLVSVTRRPVGGGPRYHAAGQVYTTRELIHFRDLTASDTPAGFGHVSRSRLRPLWPRICALLEADRRINTTFRRGINASAAFEMTPEAGSDSEIVERVRQEITEHYEGSMSDNSGGILMLIGGTLKPIGAGSASDTDLRALRQDLIREIAAMFGIPPFSVGGSGDVKFSNVVARNSQFFQNCTIPLADLIASRFELAFDTTVTYDPEVWLKGDFLHLAEVATKTAGGAILTPKMAAKRYFHVDLEGVEGADELRGATADTGDADGDRRDERPDDGSESETEAA